MITEEIIKDIDEFIQKTKEPYKLVENVPINEVEGICNKYIPGVVVLSNDQRKEILKILDLSWKANTSHGKIRQWLRLCVGIAKLLKLDNDDPENKVEIADIIVRTSRWYHSSGFYEQFVPFAKKIVSMIWGSIDNLYYKIEKGKNHNKGPKVW